MAALAMGLTAAAPAGAEVLWDADAEQPPAEEWASSCAWSPTRDDSEGVAPPDPDTSRLQRATEVVARGTYSYRSTVVPGDDCFGERAEWAQDNPSRAGFEDRLFNTGDERYISFQVYLAPGMDIDEPDWKVLAQWKQRGALGTPAISLDVGGGDWLLNQSDANSESDGTVTRWSGPAATGRWVKFTLHVKFSPDPSEGFVELWGNPAGGPLVQLLERTPTYTMKVDDSGAAVPSHARLGLYREPAEFGTETAYYDGYTVATTRADAEARAFGVPWPWCLVLAPDACAT